MAQQPYVTETKAGLGFFPYPWTPPFPHRFYARRWERPGLKRLLQPGEDALWVDLAATGILGHPWINSMPAMWGSTFWDTAITGRRFIAVQLRLLPSLKRTRTLHSIPWADATHVELCIYTGPGVVVLGIRAGPVDKRFRFAHAALNFSGAVNALREAKPDAIIKTDLLLPR